MYEYEVRNPRGRICPGARAEPYIPHRDSARQRHLGQTAESHTLICTRLKPSPARASQTVVVAAPNGTGGGNTSCKRRNYRSVYERHPCCCGRGEHLQTSASGCVNMCQTIKPTFQHCQFDYPSAQPKHVPTTSEGPTQSRPRQAPPFQDRRGQCPALVSPVVPPMSP